MKVPCYDDLTPGIPDVRDAETAGNLASLLRELPATGSQLPASGFQVRASGLYACVRLHADGGQLEAVVAVARDFSPRVRRVSDAEVLLDVSGLGRLIGPPAEIERQLALALLDARIATSVAIGPTQTIARLLAHGETAHGLTLRHKDHKGGKDHEQHVDRICELCAPRGLCGGACGRGPWQQLPVELLRELELLPPGINHRDRARPYETLQRWGIATVGELAALPAAELSSRLGRRGVALQRLARGLDPSPFVPDGDVPRYRERLELEWPIDCLEPLSFVLARLFEPLSAALERADRGAVAIRVELRLTDRATHTRLLQLPAAMRDARVLRTLVLLDLESHPPSATIDVVMIELDPAPSRITQFSLLQRALPSPETLSTLTARLSALVGESRVGSPALVDSHRPDGFAMARYAPEGAKGANGAKGAEGAGAKGAAGAGAAGAGAAGAGAAGAGAAGAGAGGVGAGGVGAGGVGAGGVGAVLRRERRSIALSVRLEQGRPMHIASSRRGVPFGAIVQAAGPWRTSGEWWSEQPWNHNEWDVALKSGAVCRIYQDRTTERWFFEGVYD